VLDTGALIALERGQERAVRFMRLAQAGYARLSVPLPVVAEWWRGRTHQRDEILAATRIITSIEGAKAAGMALARLIKRGGVRVGAAETVRVAGRDCCDARPSGLRCAVRALSHGADPLGVSPRSHKCHLGYRA
jgi:predicted nucleic acid-binding protein